MMSGRPVIVSSSAPLKRIVEGASAGLIFQANNPSDFAAKILVLYNNKNLGDTLGRNGKKVTTEGTLNWDEEQTNLVNFYNVLFNK